MYRFRISYLLVGIILISLNTLQSQNRKDSIPTISEGFPFARFQFARMLTGGDFEDTFGTTNTVGGAIGYKTKSNWQFDIEGGFMFGSDVKRQDLLNDIINMAGDATDAEGELVKLIYDIRGHSFFASASKIFPVLSTNGNSGIIIKAGIGYIQHRIKIDFRDGEVFQLSDDNLKGYDRLHTGLAAKQFLGYQHYGKKNLLNFYFGLEMVEGFTKNRRGFNYDTRSFDNGNKTDLLLGLRFGWSIPIRERASEEFYYY